MIRLQDGLGLGLRANRLDIRRKAETEIHVQIEESCLYETNEKLQDSENNKQLDHIMRSMASGLEIGKDFKGLRVANRKVVQF